MNPLIQQLKAASELGWKLTQPMEMKPIQATDYAGVFFGLSMSDYLSAPGLSKSALDRLRRSPAEFDDYIKGRIEPDTTEAMRFGSLVHAAVLERREDFVIQPETYLDHDGDPKRWNNNATLCKRWREEQTKPILRAEDAAMIREVCDTIRNDPLASPLLSDGDPEVSFWADWPQYRLKGRADWLGDGYIVDIKTTTDASTESFSAEIARRRYHVQAALYLRILQQIGRPVDEFYFIAVEKGAKVRTNIRRLKSTAIDLGNEELDRDLELFCECRSRHDWYGYSGNSGKVEEISVPPWAFMKAQEAMELSIGGQSVTV